MTDGDPHRLRTTGHTTATRQAYIDWHRHKINHAIALIALMEREGHPGTDDARTIHARTIEHHRAAIARLGYKSDTTHTTEAARRAQALTQLRRKDRTR